MNQTKTQALVHSERIRKLADTRQQILRAPVDQVMAAIFDHPQPAALIHSFPEEDLHFLIHDIGLDSAGPLLSLASNRQWEYMLDMETWRKDRLNYQQATNWLQLLLQADPERLVNLCFHERLEFLELYLFHNIELRTLESDQASSDFGDGFFTDDDTFYVRFVDFPVSTPEEETAKTRRNEMLRQLLQRLSSYDHPLYQGLLMESVNMIPGETEEELYRMRNVRLGEKGFLPFHEAVGVYQPLRPRDLAVRDKKALGPPSLVETQLPVPQFAAAYIDGDNRFVRALKSIREHHIIQQLQAELASLCNQIISADQEIIRGRDQLKAVVSKASGYLGIGLELMTTSPAESHEREAAALLRRHLLADIFRTGFAGALQLKWDATRWRKESWFYTHGVDLTFWDENWLGLLGGLLLDRPKFYDPSDRGSSYHDFQSLREIEATRRGLDQVIALDRLLNHLKIPMAPVRKIRFLTYKNLLLTLWARVWLGEAPIDADTPSLRISRSAFKKFYAGLWTDHEDHRIIGDAPRADFLKWAADASGLSETDLSNSLGSVFEALFNQIDSDLAPVEPGNLDPHHVHLFLLRP
ncbi:DUF6178 family protein [Desulfosarcina sp.]|uniref:DUF6178 family protein n=1 Tax=Desulfosarcina sp. TaxID=2027861 RepID=UPI003970E9F2